MAYQLAWKKVGVEEPKHRVWKRVAYATRYGKGVTLTEAMHLDQRHLQSLIEALGDIVEEENKANSQKK